MKNVYIPNVGDGLAAGFWTIDGTRGQIDCGSQKDAKDACFKGLWSVRPDAFFLSHFHADHYNGLFCAYQKFPKSLAIREAFFPRLPQFKQRQEFMHYMVAMNHRLLGDLSGSAVVDFLRVLEKVSSVKFNHRPLSQGDIVRLGAAHLEVLWPPAEIYEEESLAIIKKAINDFEIAVNDDDILRDILKEVEKSGEVQPYIEEHNIEAQTEAVERQQHGRERWSADWEHDFLRVERDLPGSVRKANESLRAAANRLSLAFYEDNRFLFMGDLESNEIAQVAARLQGKNREQFMVTLTPHHGTHWHDDLQYISTDYAVSSIGPKLIPKLSPEFQFIAGTHLTTYFKGDIWIPIMDGRWYGWRPWMARH